MMRSTLPLEVILMYPSLREVIDKSDQSMRLMNVLNERGVTLEQHLGKMTNLTKLAIEGYRVVRALEHDRYQVEGVLGYYNPYTNTYTPLTY